jgi:hypothetical protein
VRGGWWLVGAVAAVWACAMGGLLVLLVAGATGVVGAAEVDGPGPFLGLGLWTSVFVGVALVARRQHLATRPLLADGGAPASPAAPWSPPARLAWATAAGTLAGLLVSLAVSGAAGAWFGATFALSLLAAQRPRALAQSHRRSTGRR